MNPKINNWYTEYLTGLMNMIDCGRISVSHIINYKSTVSDLITLALDRDRMSTVGLIMDYHNIPPELTLKQRLSIYYLNGGSDEQYYPTNNL